MKSKLSEWMKEFDMMSKRILVIALSLALALCAASVFDGQSVITSIEYRQRFGQ